MRNIRIPQVFTLIRGMHKDDWEQFGNISNKKKKLSN